MPIIASFPSSHGNSMGYISFEISEDGILSYSYSGDSRNQPEIAITEDGYLTLELDGVSYNVDKVVGEDGEDATINGVSALTIEAGDNIELEQTDSVLKISAKVSEVDLSAHNADTTAHEDIREAIAGHIDDAENPHGVTAKQIGAQTAITASGLLKGDGSGGVTAAKAGTDYVTPSGSITGNAATATKLGTSTVGGTAKPIYLNAGTATACSSTVGGSGQPVYMNAGTVTGITATAVQYGGTGKTSWTANRLVYPSAATTMTQLAFPTTAGSVLRQGTSGAPYWTSVADFKTALGAFFTYGTSAPSNTNLLWIDTTATTGGLKYYNGSAWVHVPVAYT